MAKTILHFDPLRGALGPRRLTLPDAVASALVRAGVAAAADPADAGTLAAGGAVDASTPTTIVLEHGQPGATRLARISVPLAVAQIAVAAGVAAGVGLPIVGGGGVTPTPTPSPSPFLATAQRIAAAYAQRADPVLDTSVTIDVGAANRNSPVSGIPIANAPAIGQNSVSSGSTAPIVTKTNGLYMISNRTTGSKLYGRSGALHFYLNATDRFDMRVATNTGRADGSGFHILYRNTQGSGVWRKATASQTIIPLNSGTYYPFIVFPAVGNYEVMVLCDEATSIYGFNVPAGGTITAPTVLPLRIWVGEDSYWFGQGADNPIDSMAIVMSYRLGGMGVFNHGLRAAGWDELETTNNQPDFTQRADWPGNPELTMWGAQDLYVITDTVNDGPRAYSTLYPKMLSGMGKIKAAMQQYQSLYVFVQGYKPPQYTYTADQWNAGRDAFFATFGATQAEQTANGAAIYDVSKFGPTPVVPDGLLGSSSEFPGTGDVDHPNTVGHIAHGIRIAENAVMPLVTRIAATYVPTFRISSTGNRRISAAGSYRKAA